MDFTIRPVTEDDLDTVPLRCWPDRGAIANLLSRQDAIGMAAWEGDTCVAQLHGYRIEKPDDFVKFWPSWSRPGWAEKIQTGELKLPMPAWCHACCHVGRTLETCREELLRLTSWRAKRMDWDVDRIHADLCSFDAVFLSRSEVEEAVKELKESGRREFKTEAPEYRGQGIGTAMCEESVRWAKANGYASVVGTGAPNDLPECASHGGSLPQSVYTRLGFTDRLLLDDNGEIPKWMLLHPPVREEIERALADGRTVENVCSRVMVLDVEET